MNFKVKTLALVVTFLASVVILSLSVSPVTVESPGSPANAAPSAAGTFGFVGLTSVQFSNGGVGVSTFNRQCNADFPGSRICTSEEFIKTVNPPVIAPGEVGWIIATIVGGDTAGAVDYSGLTSANPANFSCLAWRSNASTVAGMIVLGRSDGDGQLWSRTCNNSVGAACCR